MKDALPPIFDADKVIEFVESRGWTRASRGWRHEECSSRSLYNAFCYEVAKYAYEQGWSPGPEQSAFVCTFKISAAPSRASSFGSMPKGSYT